MKMQCESATTTWSDEHTQAHSTGNQQKRQHQGATTTSTHMLQSANSPALHWLRFLARSFSFFSSFW